MVMMVMEKRLFNVTFGLLYFTLYMLLLKYFTKVLHLSLKKEKGPSSELLNLKNILL